MKKLQATEKITQKMTRDGAVEENKVTGEQSRISDREQLPDFHEVKETEQRDPELQKYSRRLDRATERLEQAKAGIPKKKVLQKQRIYEEATGRNRTRLRFVEVDQCSAPKLRQHPLSRPLQEAEILVHNEIHKVEQENVGVEAGHKGELLVESSVQYVGVHAASVRQHVYERTWRELNRAEQAVRRANADLLYQKTIRDHPDLQISNPLSRYLQKKRLQKDYADQKRCAAETTARTAKRTSEVVREAVKKAAEFVKRHSAAVGIVVGVLGMTAMLMAGVSSCAMMVGSGISGMFTATYAAEDPDMLGAETAYCDMEEVLQAELDAIETTYPDYDDYQYDLDEIGHDPYVLISMLSALHNGAFTLDEIQDDLQTIFSHQYILTFTEQVELIEVNGRLQRGTVLYVELQNVGIDWLPSALLTEEQLAAYAAYMSTLGNREDLFAGVPGASTLVPPTYYDIPPEALEDETFAAMIAEGEKYLGYPYVWGGSSPETSFDCSGFVCWVINHSGWSVGRTTAQGLYNVCTPVSSTNAKPGDLIFFVGTYDTPDVSHVGIYVGGGQMLHCGSPISYASVNVPYWQDHFYCFGRLP